MGRSRLPSRRIGRDQDRAASHVEYCPGRSAERKIRRINIRPDILLQKQYVGRVAPLRTISAARPPITGRKGNVSPSNEDQHKCEQCPTQSARDAGTDLQPDNRSGTQTAQPDGEKYHTRSMQRPGKGDDQAVEIIYG